MAKKIVAADVAPDGTIYVLGKVGASVSVTALKHGKKVATMPAVTGAFRVNRVGASTITIDKDGRTMRDGVMIDALERYVFDLVTVHGVSWAPGTDGRCARLGAGDDAWKPAGWSVKQGEIESLCGGKRGPIV
ncbi:MAG TPA: hypothetical protein VGC41_13095, partial [Kofleriaceae bacterium]